MDNDKRLETLRLTAQNLMQNILAYKDKGAYGCKACDDCVDSFVLVSQQIRDMLIEKPKFTEDNIVWYDFVMKERLKGPEDDVLAKAITKWAITKRSTDKRKEAQAAFEGIKGLYMHLAKLDNKMALKLVREMQKDKWT